MAVWALGGPFFAILFQKLNTAVQISLLAANVAPGRTLSLVGLMGADRGGGIRSRGLSGSGIGPKWTRQPAADAHPLTSMQSSMLKYLQEYGIQYNPTRVLDMVLPPTCYISKSEKD